MYFIPYLFNHVYLFIRCIDFSSWLGLACKVLFLILTVHSYVAPTLNIFIYLFIYLLNPVELVRNQGNIRPNDFPDLAGTLLWLNSRSVAQFCRRNIPLNIKCCNGN